jgi:hypothetical protein
MVVGVTCDRPTASRTWFRVCSGGFQGSAAFRVQTSSDKAYTSQQLEFTIEGVGCEVSVFKDTYLNT